MAIIKENLIHLLCMVNLNINFINFKLVILSL